MFQKYSLILFLQFLSFYFELYNASPLLGEKVKPARKHEFPFMVSLSRRKAEIKKERHLCGGALITKRHVLTAAHCFANRLPENLIVITGNVKIELGHPYDIESWITYDDWARENNVISEYTDNDIAVVTLKENVRAPAQPGTISRLTHEEVIERKVITAGWGFINETARLRPDTLQKAQLKVLTLPEYEEIMRGYTSRIVPLDNNYHTVAYPTALLGCGDSGGPLFLKSNNEIVGVNESSCDIDDPEEYDDVVSYHVVVDYYRDFIKDVTEK